jgi:hypothetical protein
VVVSPVSDELDATLHKPLGQGLRIVRDAPSVVAERPAGRRRGHEPQLDPGRPERRLVHLWHSHRHPGTDLSHSVRNVVFGLARLASGGRQRGGGLQCGDDEFGNLIEFVGSESARGLRTEWLRGSMTLPTSCWVTSRSTQDWTLPDDTQS